MRISDWSSDVCSSDLLVMTANAAGRGAPSESGAVWRRGAVYSGLVGLLGFAICLGGEHILLLLGQDPQVAAGAGRIMVILGLGLPAGMIYTATAFFLAGLKRSEESRGGKEGCSKCRCR